MTKWMFLLQYSEVFVYLQIYMKRFFLLTLCLSVLTVAPSAAGAQGMDYSVLCTLQQNRTPSVDKAMTWISNSLVLAPAAPVSLLTAGWISDNNGLLRVGSSMGLSFLIAGGITEGLKFSIRRPRPYLGYPDDLVPVHTTVGYSFPSGHTSLSFAVATSLSLSCPKWYVVAPSMLWAAGVGFSRLYLGVHYPSDVFTGVLVGVGSAVLAHYLSQRFWHDAEVPASKSFVIPFVFSF